MRGGIALRTDLNRSAVFMLDEPDDETDDRCGECHITECHGVDGGDVAAGYALCDALDGVLYVLHVCGKETIKAD